MIQIPEGSAPTSDDMEILEMVLDGMKDALTYASSTALTIRSDFEKVHNDLKDFGDHIKVMIGNVSNSVGGNTANIQNAIA